MKMERKEIGIMLGYKCPRDSIHKIYKRHKTILSKFVIHKDGIQYYNEEGIIEICKLSAQPDRYKRRLLEKINVKEENIKLILNKNSNMLKEQNALEDSVVSALEGYRRVDRLKKIQNTNYTVDMMIENKVILECNEDWHRYKDIEHNNKREQELKRIGYKIIKYIPGDDKMKVINTILKLSS